MTDGSITVKWFDGHLDLAYLAVCGRDLRVECTDAAAECVSLPALREGGVTACFATIFTEPGAAGPHGYDGQNDFDGAEIAGLRQFEIYAQLRQEGQLHIINNIEDLSVNDDGLRIVILMEGADPIRNPDHLQDWYDRGVRMIGLTWSAGTRYAGGNSSGGLLTSIGRELVAAMDELGVIHDASHLSIEAFDGLFACARGPIVASHSNSRAITDAGERSLNGDQIRAIADRGGLIGLNLCSTFLTSPPNRATIDDCVRHVEHIAEVAGRRDVLVLGSDMDGGFAAKWLPEELDHPRKLNRLAEALKGLGWDDEEIRGFAHGNWMRFLTREWAPVSPAPPARS